MHLRYFSLYIFVSKVLANSAKLHEFLYPTFVPIKYQIIVRVHFCLGLKLDILKLPQVFVINQLKVELLAYLAES